MTSGDENLVPSPAEALLHISIAPHLRFKNNVPMIMVWTLGALLPVTIADLWIYGIRALVLLLAGIGGATAAQWGLALVRRKKPVFRELSAFITGILLVLTLPLSTPWWVVLTGSVFAIIIAKEAFGGLGHNFINPALAARIFLQVSYPGIFAGNGAGFADQAPPLAQMQDMLGGLLWGNTQGALGSVSALAVVAGAVVLWYKRIIGFKIPFSFIVTVFVLFWATSGTGDYFSADALVVPCYQVLSGGLLIGALFCACDPVTSPITPLGKVAFGIGCAALTFAFRRWGNAEASVWFAIIFMNCTTPLMDQILRPRYFGEVRKRD
ncbi:MAG: RnfABCDGE type electron transport complex subunit D [Chitinivibrionales bacterium]|nr:RnfABCDGE type electron transport complex subunit D [Chitinivibrionales bacterium]